MFTSWHHRFRDLSRYMSKFTGWARIEELSIRRRVRIFPISWGQKARVKQCYVDSSSWLSSGFQKYVSIWTLFNSCWIFLPQSTNFREGFGCRLKGQHGPHWKSFFTEMQQQGIILGPMCLCQGKMWKSKVTNIFHITSNVGLSEWFHTSRYSSFPDCTITKASSTIENTSPIRCFDQVFLYSMVFYVMMWTGMASNNTI